MVKDVFGMCRDREGLMGSDWSYLPQGVLTSSRLGMPCDEETKCIALMKGPWGFQKCIWEP